MKKTLKLAMLGAIGAALMLVGCTKDYSSDISSLDSRVSALETKVSELDQAIKSGKVITSVESISNGIKITLSDGKSYTITNGEKGEKGDKGDTGATGATGAQGAQGEKGEQGDSPVITINTEGYWCVNGVSTGYKAQGEKGDTGATGAQGEKGDKGDTGAQGEKGDTGAQGEKGDKGDTGATGAQGAAGIYYYPCVDKTSANYGYWVKVDPNTDPATETVTTDKWLAEGTITAVWDSQNYTLTLHNVDGAEGGIVELKEVSSLKSLAFIPDEMMCGLGVIKGGYEFYAEQQLIGRSESVALYRVNGGSRADISGCKDWTFINRVVSVKSVPGDYNNLLEVVGAPEDKGEYIAVAFNFKDGATPKDLKHCTEQGGVNDIVALQTTTAEGEVITSDYAYVEAGVSISEYNIIHKNCFYQEGGIIKYRSGDCPSKTDPNDCDRCVTTGLDGLFDVSDLNYDKECDLNNFVESIFEDSGTKLLSKYGIVVTYKFTLVDNGEYTDDNATVDLTSEGIMTIAQSAKPSTTYGDCKAVGKTPMVEVKAIYKDGTEEVEIASAYIKMYISGIHTHLWIFDNQNFKLNPDYVVGTMGRLLGGITEEEALAKQGKVNEIGHIEIMGKVSSKQGGLAEHFWEYNKNLPELNDAEGKIRFSIMNYDYDNVDFTEGSPGDYTWGFFGSAPGIQGKRYVEFTHDQWESYRTSTTPADNPAIVLKNQGILEPDKYVLMKVTETCGVDENDYKDAYYYVIFKSQLNLQVNLSQLTFETAKEADVKDDIRQYICLVDASGNIIYEWSGSDFALTARAKQLYPQEEYPALYSAVVSLDNHALAYPYDTEVSFGDRLYKSGEYGITWDNMGNKLEQDKKAAYTVEVKIESEGQTYYRDGQADITVHKTQE